LRKRLESPDTLEIKVNDSKKNKIQTQPSNFFLVFKELSIFFCYFFIEIQIKSL